MDDRASPYYSPSKMADQLTEEQRNEAKEAWKKFGTGSLDDAVTVDQLGSIMRDMGQNPSQAQLADMINDVDGDGKGCMDFTDFLGLWAMRIKQREQGLEFKAMFEKMDKGGKGYLTAEEVHAVLSEDNEGLTVAEVEEMIGMQSVAEPHNQMTEHEWMGMMCST